MANDPPPPPKHTNTEKPFGVTNIKTHVPLVLDLDQLNYDAWSELFVSHLDSFGLMDHIEVSSTSTGEADLEWKKVDSLVKVWIYGTLTTSLLQTVRKKNATAANVWASLKELFHDNKEARALELENELRSMDLGSLSISEYFKRIKVISDLLTNIDSPVEEKTLVMYAINGLDDKFEHVTSIIRHSAKRPTLLETRSMLLVEESRLNRKSQSCNGQMGNTSGRDDSSSPTVLLAGNNSGRPSGQMGSNNRGSREVCRNFQKGTCKYGDKCRFIHTKGNKQQVWRGNSPQQSGQQWSWATQAKSVPFHNVQASMRPPTRPQWVVPPPATSSQVQAYGPSGPGLLGPTPASYGPISPSPTGYWNFGPYIHQATSIPQAHHTDILQYATNTEDTGWYMDTGATSHLTADKGLLDATTSAPM